MGHRMLPTEFFPERSSLPWQQNLGHNWLDLSLSKRYNEDLCVRWGIFDTVYDMGSARAQLFGSAHMHPHKNHTLNIRKIIIIYQQKTFLHFLTLL